MSDCDRLSDRMPAVALGRGRWTREESAISRAAPTAGAEWELVRPGGAAGRGAARRLDRAGARRLRCCGADLAERRPRGRAARWVAAAAALAAAAVGRRRSRREPSRAMPGRAPVAAGRRCRCAELEAARDRAELDSLLQSMDEPLAGWTMLESPGLGDLDEDELEQVLAYLGGMMHANDAARGVLLAGAARGGPGAARQRHGPRRRDEMRRAASSERFAARVREELELNDEQATRLRADGRDLRRPVGASSRPGARRSRSALERPAPAGCGRRPGQRRAAHRRAAWSSGSRTRRASATSMQGDLEVPRSGAAGPALHDAGAAAAPGAGGAGASARRRRSAAPSARTPERHRDAPATPLNH